MPLILWGPNLKVGIALIDQQHEKLVALINSLNDALGAGKAQSVLVNTLDELIAYTKTHFAAEEELMRDHAYPNAQSHRTEHAKLIEKVDEMRRQFEAGGSKMAGPLLRFLCDWLTTHILETDVRLGRALQTRGVK